MQSTLARGFSLIEIVVAVGVIGAVFALAQAMVGTVPLARLAKSQSIALTIATHKIEEVRGAGYAAVPASGPFVDSLQSSFASSSAALLVSDFNAKTKSVVATVWWEEPGSATPYSISLTTLMTETGGLP